MSLCARAVALWLAACALVARAQVNSIPECAPLPNQSCQLVRTQHDPIYGGDQSFYTVNGHDIMISSTPSEDYWSWCMGRPLDVSIWPRFPTAVSFNTVELVACAPPPTRTFAEALKTLNVSIVRKLSMSSMPANATFSAGAFAGLPPTVNALELSAFSNMDEEGLLMLEPGALATLDGIEELKLWNVRADVLPKHLKELNLMSTGIDTLPPEAFYVTKLRVMENNLTTINGSMPRLQTLVIQMTVLKTLVLHDIASSVLTDKLLHWCWNLTTLELRRAHSSSLPPFFLDEAKNLKIFRYTQGNITELPEAFFEHNFLLEVVDLSENKLGPLSSKQFSKLTKLRVLRLENNQLSARDLQALKPLKALTVLDLSGNPLGDLCCNATSCPLGRNMSLLSPLKQLQKLSLARTLAPHVCADWFQDLPALRHLDLRENQVSTITCADFRSPRSLDSNNTIVELEDNPLEQFHCSKDDEERPELEFKEVTLWTGFFDECDCDCNFLLCISEPKASPKLNETDIKSIFEYLSLKNMSFIQIRDELYNTLGKIAPSYSKVKEWAAEEGYIHY